MFRSWSKCSHARESVARQGICQLFPSSVVRSSGAPRSAVSSSTCSSALWGCDLPRLARFSILGVMSADAGCCALVPPLGAHRFGVRPSQG